MGPAHRLLPDGRLHLHHGPIDMIVAADGPAGAVRAAFDRAVVRFSTLLAELVAELDALRRPVGPGPCPVHGPVARRMWAACLPHASREPLSPMAAVAGADAQAVLDAMVSERGLDRVHVNNGGDIALFLAPGAAPFRIALAVNPAAPVPAGVLTVTPDQPVRGIATSGAPGRSHSRGIADSVTVLAGDAVAADVAATLIANAVDLPGHPAIIRAPARSLSPDSDLGERLVTTAVGPLAPAEVDRALDPGERAADQMRAAGLIHAAVLIFRDRIRVVGDCGLAPPPDARKIRASVAPATLAQTAREAEWHL